MTLFAWDELGNTIEPRFRDELDECTEEGGWELEKTYDNGVRRFRTDRHTALDVEANSIEEAEELFKVDETYRSYL